MTEEQLPPIVREIIVSWSQEAAFNKFTNEFGKWWPVRTHSIGGSAVMRIVFETCVDGLIFEQHVDGRRFQWGQVCAWEPPRMVRFSWHPSRDPATAQDVEVTFSATPEGTRVVLTSSGWERWGEKAKAAHRGYDIGWAYILNIWAGKHTVGMMFLDGLAAVMGLIQKLRGGRNKIIAEAKGEIGRA